MVVRFETVQWLLKISASRLSFASNGVTMAGRISLENDRKRPLVKDIASLHIKGAKTSTHDFMIVVGYLSIGYDLNSIDRIGLQISSLGGGLMSASILLLLCE